METKTESNKNTEPHTEPKVDYKQTGMDANNQKAFDIMSKEGTQKALEFMFQHPNEKNADGTPRNLSYGEMRSFYG
jgi:hypothetical protein